jgi:hypothetical protein
MKLKDLAIAQTSARGIKEPDVKWFRQHGVFRNEYIERNEKGELVISGNRNHVVLTNVDDLPYPFHLKYWNLTIEDSLFEDLQTQNLPPEAQYINFERCSAMRVLPDLSKLNELQSLQIVRCRAFEKFSALPENIGSLICIDTGLTNLQGINIKHSLAHNLHLERNNNFETFEGSGLTETNTMTIYGSKSLKSLDGAPNVAFQLTLGGLPNLSFSNIHRQFPGARTISFDTYNSQKWKYRGPLLSLLNLKNLIELKFKEDAFSNKDFFKALTIINKHLKTRDIVEAMDELMEAGLKEYAKL